ncbi:MAG: hypothetical protein WC581_06185 [Thermodesulfovibrionales bacterium]
MPFDLKDLWTAGGVLLGFEVTAFSWRIKEESMLAREKNEITWLPPADFLNLLAMLAASIGIFVLPVLGFSNLGLVKVLFGLSTILFVGHAFAIAGHYELFNWRTKRSFKYFPMQEKIVIIVVSIVSLFYLFVALQRL